MRIDSSSVTEGDPRDIERLAEEIAVLEERLRALVDRPVANSEREELRQQWERLNAISMDLAGRLELSLPEDHPELRPTTKPLAVSLPLALPKAGRRTLLGRMGAATTIFGVLLAAFLAFEFFVSDLSEARAQRALLSGFKEVMSGGAFVAPPPDAIGQEEVEVVAPTGPLTGAPVALLQIPNLGFEKVVVEGTTAEETKKGPGHLTGSPLPGEVGKVVIAGRRTTYGSPFNRLDDLAVGAEIVATTPKGRFTYEVTEVKVIKAGEPDVFAPDQSSNTMVLTTSDPEYVASGRLVVLSQLTGDAVSLPENDPVLVDEGMTGLAGDTTSTWLILLWAQLLLAALVVTWFLYRRWSAWSTYLISTPIAIALLFLLFENLDRLLPSTL